MKLSFVRLTAPGLHLSLASHCTDTQHSPCQLSFSNREGITLDLTSCVTLPIFACCEIQVQSPWWCIPSCRRWAVCVCLAPTECATASTPRLSCSAQAGTVTYVCVIRSVSWVSPSKAQQLEKHSQKTLFREHFLAMACRQGWQYLTLDSCSRISSSWSQRKKKSPKDTHSSMTVCFENRFENTNANTLQSKHF